LVLGSSLPIPQIFISTHTFYPLIFDWSIEILFFRRKIYKMLTKLPIP